ncbi:MAG: response regulator [Thermodesulfobacteriota bacterium]|nr:response regulator [Thermodesulfobacteriota bacterium]
MAQQGSILIVDDEAGPRESLRMILKPIYKIYTAANGKEALVLIQKEKIDLVTLDLNMPGLTGVEVLKEIKKIKSDIEVIIITGYGTLKNAQEVIRYGAGDFISKPFNVADIVAIISKSFERRNYNLKINNLIQQIKGLRNIGEDQEREITGVYKAQISS